MTTTYLLSLVPELLMAVGAALAVMAAGVFAILLSSPWRERRRVKALSDAFHRRALQRSKTAAADARRDGIDWY